MNFSELSMRERAQIIKEAVANGYTKRADIEKAYNEFISEERNPDYDMAGFARENPDQVFNHQGHYPDTFKKPNHPTFSNESRYSTEKTPGGQWSEREGVQRWNFTPSQWQLSQPGYVRRAIDYLNNSESQGVTLTNEEGAQPVIDGAVYGGVLPEVEVTAHLHSFGSWLKQKLGLEEKPEETPKITYTRQQENDSPTKEASEKLEDRMNSNLRGHSGQYDHKWDIPYIPDKETKIVGNRVSTNALDSLAKYAEITGVPIEEAVGLALYETHLGGSPFINYKDGAAEANRALGNASFFRNYGYIPAWALIRDNEYITEGYDKTKEQKAEGMSPLEHGLLIYKSGKYNTGLGPGVHTARVKSKAAAVKKDTNYQQWLEDRNQHSTGGPLYPFSFSKKGIPEVRM